MPVNPSSNVKQNKKMYTIKIEFSNVHFNKFATLLTSYDVRNHQEQLLFFNNTDLFAGVGLNRLLTVSFLVNSCFI
ncbi:hypothetical protein ACIQ1H_13135 [Lysinibacillus sp. NPDC097279]|uniref:hypothetical protein n=1 Tax=Lysinibacillus sp. NPDC097279 TaxID=3364143 RepID=UPI00381EF9CA